MIERLAWVTTSEARGRDADEPLGLAALAQAGVDVEVVDWDDSAVDWSTFDRVALRSAWDYAQRLPEFLSWLDQVSVVCDVVNSPATVQWNLDKQYLSELEQAGVPITHTAFIAPGEQPQFPDGDFVVKPAVGAGSRDAASYGADDHHVAVDHVARLHLAGQVVLVQPFVASVATEGEWPLVFFDGTFSHSASKRVVLPRAGSVTDLFAAEVTGPHTASPAQLDVAQAAFDAVCRRLGTPRYARIDLVHDDDGQYRVLEVELIEPSLFLQEAGDGAAHRLASALAR